jgi:hypothetical protein
LPAREAARLVQTLALAMQAAHDKSVIHRDLKLANVLLAEDGTPKISDFGLAKKLDDVGQTQPGAIMGTPSYMAPEQASGKEIGPAADVYALGAVLYELLTGRPPFKAATTLDTILQVISDEPVPPAQLQSKTPRDLETICLKCLSKEPSRRYATARALAEDLGRFVAGLPVHARPVGRWERGWRWCQRNPVVAALTAAMLLTLMAGVTGVSYFALEARREAQEKGQEAENVRRSEAKVKQSNDRLLTSVARSLLRPLAVDLQPNQPVPPLGDTEIDALWELASTPEEEIHLRFVAEALRDEVLTRQLKDRAAHALRAAVGLDAGRRARVEQVLAEGLQATESDPEQQRDVALVLAHLGVHDAELAGRVALVLSQARAREKDPSALQRLAEGLSALAARMGPQEAAVAAGPLSLALSRETTPYALQQLAESLSVLAARMEPREATVICGLAARSLSQAMTRTAIPDFLQQLAEGLGMLAARMERQEAAVVCGQAARILGQTLNTTTDRVPLRSLTKGLSAVAGHLEPKEAAVIASILVQAMTRTRDELARRPLADGLSAVARRLEPKEAAAAAATLSPAMPATKGASGLQPVTMVPTGFPPLVQGLSALASRMEGKEAAATLSQAMTLDAARRSPPSMQSLVDGLLAVSTRLEPPEAAAVAATLCQVMSTANWQARQSLAQGLSAVAIRMEPREAAAILSRALLEPGNLAARQSLVEGLSKVAARLGPNEAAVIAASLSQTLNKETNPGALHLLAQALPPIAARMEPREAAVVCGQAASCLSRATANPGNTAFQHELMQDLSAVAARLGPREAAAVAAPHFQVMTRTMDPLTLQQLAEGLSVLADRMEPREAAGICGQAAGILSQAMTTEASPYLLPSLAQGLAALASRMEPKEAARVCSQAAGILFQVLSRETSESIRQGFLAKGLSALAAHLGPGEAAAVCGQAAGILLRAMNRERIPGNLQALAEGLSALAARMGPKEAAEICGRAARILSRAMTRTKVRSVFPDLALPQGLSAVAAWMEPSEAALCLFQAMSETTNPRVLEVLANELSAVLSREVPTTSRQRCLAVTGTVAGLSSPEPLFAVPVLFESALVPPPPPLPAQTLVDLLKSPLCVGEAQRLVLGQLARHCQRPFADQWDFVRFAEERQLGLDLTTPPPRPEPLPIKR